MSENTNSAKIIENNNDNAKVNSIIENAKNDIAEDTAEDIFSSLLNLESITNIAEDIANAIKVDLSNASFMNVDLELTEKQKERMLKYIDNITLKAKDNYLKKIKTDERTKQIANIVESNLKKLADEIFKQVSSEVNRGAMISATAVSADCKNKDYNRIELNYSKVGCDITIPTKGLFISTNCIEMIRNSVEMFEETEETNVKNKQLKYPYMDMEPKEIEDAKRKEKERESKLKNQESIIDNKEVEDEEDIEIEIDE